VFKWPEPTHFVKTRNGEFKSDRLLSSDLPLFRKNDVLPARTVRDAIGEIQDLNMELKDHVTIPAIKEKDSLIIKHIGKGQKLCNVRFSETSVYTWEIPEVFGEVSDYERDILMAIAKNRRKKKYGLIPNGNPLSSSEISQILDITIKDDDLERLKLKGYLKKIDEKYDLKGAMFCSGLYKRPLWDEPSPTIITLFHNPRNFLHPEQNRPFTIRECARLQSFPDAFLFTDSGISIEDSYRLIGNAVAPLLAEQIAKSIYSYLDHSINSETKTIRQEQGQLVAGV
jgi:DNA (cytosine-5)-methyltransferase 1